MLVKTQRLTRHQFQDFFSSGKRFRSVALTVVYTPYPTFHAAVVVGKKISKSAVVRNRYRRRIYEQLRVLARKHNLTGVFIMLTSPQIRTLSRTALRDTIVDVVGRTQKSP
jgi:ribonuclease P protein component